MEIPMSDLTAERRLALVRHIREENERNRTNIQSRQQILYGQDGSLSEPYFSDMPPQNASFGLRFLAALTLFILFVLWSRSGASVFGQDPAVIGSLLQTNYELKNIDFVEKITYTLTNAPSQEENIQEETP